MILERIEHPADLRALSPSDLGVLCDELRTFIVDTVSMTGGHLGSNLGAVELTLAIHRVFDSPRDLVIFDTGHQAYVHKLLTGRRKAFSTLRQEGGLSGYPNRTESPHDWVENSHASTSLSWAYGLASAIGLGTGPTVGALHGSLDSSEGGSLAFGEGRTAASERCPRRVVAVVGDGALTGGLAYEALNNLGHAELPVIIVLNDNGRSYAPTVSKLSESLTKLRLSSTYVSTRRRVKAILDELPPGLGPLARSSIVGLTAALREAIEPQVFFEALGVRYTGPIDGHDIAAMESALTKAAAWEDGPIVVHVLTHKGKGYGPAEDDEVACLHDLKVVASVPTADALPSVLESPALSTSPLDDRQLGAGPTPSFIDAFSRAMLEAGALDQRVVALTAAMPGPTGLLPFAEMYPERFFDVGIAEAHATTAAAGMAMGGLKPVVAVYSTFFSRAFDQANLDVGLHRLPVVFAIPSAGITGVDGPSHHGVLDLAQCLSIPGMVVFAPSSPAEVGAMLLTALDMDAPCSIRFPKTPYLGAPSINGKSSDLASPMDARKLRTGDGSVCVLAVGKLLGAACKAAAVLQAAGVSATVWDVRVVRPADPSMLADAAGHELVVTVEDGIRVGGAGSYLADAISSMDTGGRPPCFLNLGIPHAYLAHGHADSILDALGLNGPGIASSIRVAMDRWATSAQPTFSSPTPLTRS